MNTQGPVASKVSSKVDLKKKLWVLKKITLKIFPSRKKKMIDNSRNNFASVLSPLNWQLNLLKQSISLVWDRHHCGSTLYPVKLFYGCAGGREPEVVQTVWGLFTAPEVVTLPPAPGLVALPLLPLPPATATRAENVGPQSSHRKRSSLPVDVSGLARRKHFGRGCSFGFGQQQSAAPATPTPSSGPDFDPVVVAVARSSPQVGSVPAFASQCSLQHVAPHLESSFKVSSNYEHLSGKTIVIIQLK